MAVKVFEVDGVGSVRVFKRPGTRQLRLSIDAKGSIRLTIPYYTTYGTGLQFIKDRAEWISRYAPPQPIALKHGDYIGKAHRLCIAASEQATPSSRLSGSEIRILRPVQCTSHSDELQALINRACIRALRLQAAKLLPKRLERLADLYGFAFASVQVKQLKGRWGSCDNQRRIVLNLYLMQLPWHLIDYVLLHELVHTKYMNHGEGFWNEFIRHQPRARELRQEIKNHQPVLSAVDRQKVVS